MTANMSAPRKKAANKLSSDMILPSDIHDRVSEAYYGKRGKEFMRATQRRVHWICANVHGNRVLDIGCSQGIAAILLGREGKCVTGIDVADLSIRQATDYLAEEPSRVQERVSFVVGDFLDHDFGGERFDTVILGEVLEHLLQPGAFIEAAADRLVENGRLIVTVPFGINDFPDHKHTFYLFEPYRLVSKRFAVTEVKLFGKWLGLVGRRLAEDEREATLETLPSELLVRTEASFYELERKLVDQTVTLKRHLEDAKSKSQTMSEENSVLREQLAKQDGAIAALQQQLSELREETKRAAEQRRRVGRTIKSLETRAHAVEGSTSFAVGNAIVRAATSPKLALRLPVTMWSLYRSRRSDKTRAMRIAEQNSAGVDTSKLIALYEAGRSEAVISATKAQYENDLAGASKMLIRSAKALSYAGYPEAEFPLVAEAARLEPSEPSLRALYWAANREGDAETTWRCIKELRKFYTGNLTHREQALQKKMERNPACQLSVLEHIERVQQRAYAPVPNRLCYVLHNSLPFSSGGYATRAHGMALGFAQAGIEVTCLTRPGYPLDTMTDLKGGDFAQGEVIDGVDYQRILSPLRTTHTASDYMLGAADTLVETFERLRPEWVMAASNFLTAIPALIACRRLGIPFFYEVRGFWEITRLSREPEYSETMAYKVYEVMEARTAKEADHVFTLTNPMRDELVHRGVSTEHVSILPNSCTPERFKARPKDQRLAESLGIPGDVPVVGYVGTFAQYEGLDDLVSAAALLKGQGTEFRLLLVGNENTSGSGRGPITEKIQRIAQENGLESWLIMPGRIPHDQVEAFYSLIDIAPFPRKPQPVTELVSPMKPLEALAMEKAVIVSSVAALTEMIKDNETGLVFKKGDLQDLATALMRLIDDPDLRVALGKNGRRWIEQERTWAKTAQKAKEKLYPSTTDA